MNNQVNIAFLELGNTEVGTPEDFNTNIHNNVSKSILSKMH